MASNAERITIHRRALTGGLSISVAAHAVALTLITVPGGGSGEAGVEAPRRVDDSFDAIEVIALAARPSQPAAPAPPVPDPAPTTATGTPSATALDDLLSDIAPAPATVALPNRSTPVVTLRDLEPIGPSAALTAALYGTGALEGEGEEGGGVSGLLGRIGAALAGGAHCPTPTKR